MQYNVIYRFCLCHTNHGQKFSYFIFIHLQELLRYRAFAFLGQFISARPPTGAFTGGLKETYEPWREPEHSRQSTEMCPLFISFTVFIHLDRLPIKKLQLTPSHTNSNSAQFFSTEKNLTDRFLFFFLSE